MGVGLEAAVDVTWRALASSVAGAGHRARGTVCAAASAVDVLEDGTRLRAVADGAGSAPLAADGSARAVSAAMEAMRAGVPMEAVVEGARLALEPVADGERLGDRATTLLVVRVATGGEVLETAQVGDGAVVLRGSDGALSVLAADAKGEYLNETCFLTSDWWRDSLRIESVPSDGIDGVAVLTDGLQLLALDLATGAPHAPFFAPFFSFVAGDGDEAELSAFLASDRVGERTDDDVTLAVAAVVPRGT